MNNIQVKPMFVQVLTQKSVMMPILVSMIFGMGTAYAVEISDVNGLQTALDDKADKLTVNTLTNTVNNHSTYFTQVVAQVGDIRNSIATNRTLINTKADITYVDSQNAAQDTAIATKANQTDLDITNQKIDGIKTQVDTNTSDIATNTNNINTLASTVNSFDSRISTAETTATNAASKVDTFDGRVTVLESNYQNIDSKINNLDKELSAGIASATALAMMPTPNAGAHYVTGGTGFYNGESAVSIGFSGTAITGKFSYKIGGSVTSSGSGAFGAGVGFRWR